MQTLAHEFLDIEKAEGFDVGRSEYETQEIDPARLCGELERGTDSR